jgi:4-hydroxybenzoate polyprenyltransferase
MRAAAAKPASFDTLLRLGRISNLPTVWTNVWAGTVIAAGALPDWRIGTVLLSMSLLYVGGMYLNDYFDRTIDASERRQRPIPAGDISAGSVAAIGFAMLGTGVILVAAASVLAGLTSALLALVIIVYDAFHKGSAVAPLLMGLCRALVYCVAAVAAVGSIPSTVLFGALALLCYVAGITYAARQESVDRVGSLWPLLLLACPILLSMPALRLGLLATLILLFLIATISYATYLLVARPFPGAVSRAIGILIAGISLSDAALLASVGALGTAVAAALGFPTTLLLQKYIPGT